MDRAIILVEPQRFTEAWAAIALVAPSARTFLASPLCIATVDDPGLEKVRSIPGVVAVTTANDLELGLLAGIDRAIGLCLGLVDDWTVGGVQPGSSYPFAFGEPVGSVASTAICAAVNLSLTPPEDDVAPTEPSDVVNYETHAASAFAVPVVAAGNHHTAGAAYETVSPWAEPPWVLSVGATEDEAGQFEWPHSGRGTASNPSVGPDILAWGQDALSSTTSIGTSYAAARVSGMVVLTRTWLFQVAANIERLAERPFGVPLVGLVMVDERFAPLAPPTFNWDALPVLATMADPFPYLSREARQNLAAHLVGSPGVQAARVLVEAAAKATSPEVTGQLSAPSITLERLKTFLDELTGPALLRLLGPSQADSGLPAELPIFSSGSADRMWELMLDSMPIWQWDIETREPRMRHQKEEQP
jgi:subtilase family protein